MKNAKFKKILLVIGAGTVLLGTTVAFSAGSKDDPLISLSYLETRLDELEDKIDKKISRITDDIDDNTGQDRESYSFEIVEISAGQYIIGKEGTEIILRGGTSTSRVQGKAKVVTFEVNGLSDITSGKELLNGDNVPLNHLLIVPRNNRGIQAITDSTYLVKGEYEIR